MYALLVSLSLSNSVPTSTEEGILEDNTNIDLLLFSDTAIKLLINNLSVH